MGQASLSGGNDAPYRRSNSWTSPRIGRATSVSGVHVAHGVAVWCRRHLVENPRNEAVQLVLRDLHALGDLTRTAAFRDIAQDGFVPLSEPRDRRSRKRRDAALRSRA